MNRLGSAAARCPAMVTNVLPLRVAVDPAADLVTLVDRVAAAAGAVRRGGRYRAERLQRDLGLLVSGNPLTLAELNIKLFDAPVEVPGVAVTVRNLAEGPLDDLSFSVGRTPDGVIGWVASGPAGAAEDEVRGHLDGVTALFEELVAAAGTTAVGSIGASAPAVIEGPALGAWPDPAERFAQSVAAHPDRTALVSDGTTWSYRALDERVAAEAGRIRAAGAGIGDLVAVDLPRGADYVVALLALHRLGAVAVALDAEWPETRRREMLGRLGASYTLSGLGEVAGDPVTAPVPVPADALAYVIHTSGSTGFPKAVGITRAGLGHFVAHHERVGLFAEAPADRPLRVAQTLALAFDGSWDTLQGVLLGHEVHLVDRDTGRDPAALRALLAAERIDLIDTMPSFVAALLDEGLLDDGQPAPSRISVGGEACSTALWQRLRACPGLRVLNLYGPTEFTVDALGATGADTDRAVIGRPLADTTALVLDRHLQPVPAGVRGELYLAGVQEARGYLGQSGLTAERFVANPYGPPGSRMYRTGDVVSVGPDGLVRYHGRRDGQAKIRGFRVEPAEVEAALAALPGVSTAAVVVGDQRLLGYAVPGPGTTLDGATLRAALAERLPAHLVPAHVVVLDALPVTTTGKLDASALPQPTADPSAAGRAPAGPAEQAVAAAVAEVLPEAGELGADSDFFALGGDSITAIRAVAALRRAGWTSSVRDVFRLRTVAGIAAAAVRAPDAGSAAPTAPAAPQSLVELDANQMGQLGDLLARRTRRKASL
ncbi:AMP-binding protein [Nocardioides humi]|nr:AMP-binding protein [Nocardioides humi]